MSPPVLLAGPARGVSYVVQMIEADRPIPGSPALDLPERPRVLLPPDQAAAVPYRVRDGGAEVLLVTSRTRARWIVPKGAVERGATPPETARAEAFEEAGVRGVIRPNPLGRYHHGRGRRAALVEVYLLHVTDEAGAWPEHDDRARRWVPAPDAAAEVDVAGLRPVLRRATEVLAALDPR